MIGLIRCAGFNRRPQLNKHRRARPQPQMPRRRPRRVSRLFPVMRPRVLPLRRAAPGCGTPPIAILSTVLLSRPGILRPNKQRNNPAKPTGLTVAACAIPPTPLRRQQGRRRGERGSPVQRSGIRGQLILSDSLLVAPSSELLLVDGFELLHRLALKPHFSRRQDPACRISRC